MVLMMVLMMVLIMMVMSTKVTKAEIDPKKDQKLPPTVLQSSPIFRVRRWSCGLLLKYNRMDGQMYEKDRVTTTKNTKQNHCNKSKGKTSILQVVALLPMSLLTQNHNNLLPLSFPVFPWVWGALVCLKMQRSAPSALRTTRACSHWAPPISTHHCMLLPQEMQYNKVLECAHALQWAGILLCFFAPPARAHSHSHFLFSYQRRLQWETETALLHIVGFTSPEIS